jgi:glycerophosphoryl diester phosphodiesterase
MITSLPPICTTIAAHRGGAGLWPENSPTAFGNAIGLGVDYIETDVHLSLDGEPVIIHDPQLDRTTTGSGPVGARGWKDIKGLILKGTEAETLPHLRDVTDILKPSCVNLRLEIKIGHENHRYAGIEDRVADLLASAGMLGRTVITSFQWDILTDFPARAEPKGFIGLIKPDTCRQMGGVEEAMRRLADRGLTELGVHESLISEDAIDTAIIMGLRLGAYGANNASQIGRVLAAKASTFTTDRPDIAVAMRQELRPEIAGDQ